MPGTPPQPPTGGTLHQFMLWITLRFPMYPFQSTASDPAFKNTVPDCAFLSFSLKIIRI